MTIYCNVSGSERKRLVTALAKWLTNESGELVKAKYLGAPSFAYQIGEFTVGADGAVSCPVAPPARLHDVARVLSLAGFEPDTREISASETVCAETDNLTEDSGIDTTLADSITEQDDGTLSLTILLPRSAFTADQFENFKKIVAGKQSLLKKVFDADELDIIDDAENGRIALPWVRNGSDLNAMQHYARFIEAMASLAQNAHRVLGKERPIESEKYAMRCFLLRLGFIGDEYKETRKFLLRNLSGSSAWKNRQTAKELRQEANQQ